MRQVTPSAPAPPAPWAILLAFTLVYLAWGTTYLAIREGVKQFPPGLFGGLRLTAAGLILFAFLALRGEPLRLRRRELFWVGLAGLLLFVGGNGLITVGERTVDSGVASILVATTPLWMGFIEMFWPGGERLSARGWTGLLIGLAGVVLLLTPKLQHPAQFLQDVGPFLVLGSALSWSVGSLVLRRHRSRSHLAAAAYQMVLGGGIQTLIGLGMGEATELTPEKFTPGAVYAFFHLLVVGSLIGFVAYNWLLGHVSATLAGTYAYVNPVIAVLVGGLWGEIIDGWVIGGMAVILAGVALVRTGAGGLPRQAEVEVGEEELDETLLVAQEEVI